MPMGQLPGKQLVDNTVTGSKIADAPNGITTGKINDDAVDEDKLDLSATYDFDTGGGDIQVADTPATGKSAVNQNYVDSVAEGLDPKDSCVAVETVGNRTLSGLTPNVDGVVLSDGDRVLLTQQTSGIENGIWVAHTGAWTRPSDFDTGANVSGSFAFITEGTTYESSGWVCINDTGADVVGTDNLSFTQFSGATAYTWGNGLDSSGTTVYVGENATGCIQANADDVEVLTDDVTIEDDGGTAPAKLRVKDAGIDENKLNTSVAGAGLSGGGGSALAVGDVNKGMQVNANDVQVDASEIAQNGLAQVSGVGNEHLLTVDADTTGGANLARAINVTANGVAVKVDDSTIQENGSQQLEVKDDGVTGAKLAAAVAGDGLVQDGSGNLDVNAGNGIAISSDAVIVQADATGGANLARAIDVNANGVAVKVDDSTIQENGSQQLEIKDDGVTGAKLAAAVAGDGLVQDGSGNLDVNAGNGITISGDAVTAQADATGGSNLAKAIDVNANGIAVKIDDTTIREITATNRLVGSEVPSDDMDQTPASTSGDYQDTGIDISHTPAGDRVVRVSVNGIQVRLANGNRDQGAAYFSADSGATARAWGSIVAGDSLYWNGGSGKAKYDLDSGDRVDIVYGTAQVA